MVPLPDKETITVGGSLEGMVRLADWGPSDAGVKIREILAEASGGRMFPEMLPLEIVNWLSVPSLVTVTVRGELDELTGTGPKLMLVGSTVISGSTPPVPLKGTSNGSSSGSLE